MQRNIRKIRNILLSFGVYFLLSLSLTGTLIGTYAWYQYEVRVKSNFNGTSINDIGTFRVGLFSETALHGAASYGLVRDTSDQRVYWGQDGLGSVQLNYFLAQTGHATNIIMPVTSGSRSVEDELVLHPNPTRLDNSAISELADKERYVYLPLVFQIIGETSTANLYYKDINARSSGNLSESIRIFTKSESSSFLAAADIANDGYDDVGGVLNLGDDKYYDFESGKEFSYGEFETLVYNDEVTEDEVDEIDNPSTFNAIHKKGIYAIDETRSVAKKAYYLGYDSLLNKQKAIASVSGDYTRVDLTIFVEGWSKNVTNSQIATNFNLDLTFELGA